MITNKKITNYEQSNYHESPYKIRFWLTQRPRAIAGSLVGGVRSGQLATGPGPGTSASPLVGRAGSQDSWLWSLGT